MPWHSMSLSDIRHSSNVRLCPVMSFRLMKLSGFEICHFISCRFMSSLLGLDIRVTFDYVLSCHFVSVRFGHSSCHVMLCLWQVWTFGRHRWSRWLPPLPPSQKPSNELSLPNIPSMTTWGCQTYKQINKQTNKQTDNFASNFIPSAPPWQSPLVLIPILPCHFSRWLRRAIGT